jgi:hypothetical protein
MADRVVTARLLDDVSAAASTCWAVIVLLALIAAMLATGQRAPASASHSQFSMHSGDAEKVQVLIKCGELVLQRLCECWAEHPAVACVLLACQSSTVVGPLGEISVVTC